MRNATLIIVLGVHLMSGCATVDLKKESRIELNGGAITISYSKDGEFLSLESRAIAKVTSSLPNARDEAATIATLRARRQIVEFLKTDIESEQFLKTVTNSDQKSDESDGLAKAKSVRADISYTLRESLRQRSSGVIQGSYVISEKYDPSANVITVKVGVGKPEKNALAQLRNYLQ